MLGAVLPYDGKRICLNNQLDQYLIPIMKMNKFEEIAKWYIDRFYPKNKCCRCRISGKEFFNAIGYKIRYVRLSVDGKVKSKFVFTAKEITVYDEGGTAKTIYVEKDTILIDISRKGHDDSN